LGIYPKDCDTGYSRGTCIPMFIAALFTIAMESFMWDKEFGNLTRDDTIAINNFTLSIHDQYGEVP
jgi:hypothetical protein